MISKKTVKITAALSFPGAIALFFLALMVAFYEIYATWILKASLILLCIGIAALMHLLALSQKPEEDFANKLRHKVARLCVYGYVLLMPAIAFSPFIRIYTE